MGSVLHDFRLKWWSVADVPGSGASSRQRQEAGVQSLTSVRCPSSPLFVSCTTHFPRVGAGEPLGGDAGRDHQNPSRITRLVYHLVLETQFRSDGTLPPAQGHQGHPGLPGLIAQRRS